MVAGVVMLLQRASPSLGRHFVQSVGRSHLITVHKRAVFLNPQARLVYNTSNSSSPLPLGNVMSRFHVRYFFCSDATAASTAVVVAAALLVFVCLSL